jgi:hypothetical protein
MRHHCWRPDVRGDSLDWLLLLFEKRLKTENVGNDKRYHGLLGTVDSITSYNLVAQYCRIVPLWK